MNTDKEQHMSIAKEMLQTHPNSGLIHKEMFAACIRECFDCAQACTGCADACLSERDSQQLVSCIRINLNCADVCIATGRVLARPTEPEWGLLYNQLQACIVACQACAVECERHSHHPHCQLCAQACRRCEQACLGMLNQLPRAGLSA